MAAGHEGRDVQRHRTERHAQTERHLLERGGERARAELIFSGGTSTYVSALNAPNWIERNTPMMPNTTTMTAIGVVALKIVQARKADATQIPLTNSVLRKPQRRRTRFAMALVHKSPPAQA